MNSYLYPKILIDFWLKRPSEKEELESPKKKADWLSFYSFLKKETNLFLNLDLSTHDHTDERNPLNKIIPLLVSGRDKTSFSADPSHFSPLESANPIINIKKQQALICFDNSISNIQEKKGHNGYFIWSLNDYYKMWQKIRDFENKSSNGITVGENGVVKSWSDLKFLRHPCNTIIISDRYLLCDKQRGLNTLIGIFSNLFFIFKQRPKVLIISPIDKVFEKNIDRLFNIISQALLEAGFYVDFNLLIAYSNTMKHDRKIISNYFHFDSGDSWDYFEPNGKFKTKGTKINVIPIFNNPNNEALQQSLEEIKIVMKNRNSEKRGDNFNETLLELE
ncbi:hypothetical protein [Agriterribacter sp.]|uniref:hypothetical protein n=1 Tax=Agriterribacter sp. TaxID=2821509 RepID=UPI002B900EB7|nr:hypothetical protein [Agriterribacter sp.]HRP57158.1 hypothetical protein [Agriterribacter sp.]